tara:strand:+ start:693 stop:2591 length:1899 start_codon:yes stop_codon:yes gene_type:complete
MAEKIIEIKLNSKEAEKQLESLDESIENLEGGVSDLQRGLNSLEKELTEVTGATGRDIAKRKQLTDLINKTKTNLKQEKEALKETTKQRQKANKTLTKSNKKLKEQAKNHNDVSKGLTKSIGGTGVLDKATGGLFSSFQGLIQGTVGLIRSLGLVRIAMFAIPIVAIVTALGSLVAAFTSSEEGQNKLTKALNQAKAVITNVTSLLTNLGTGITNAFSALIDGDIDGAIKAVSNTYETVAKKISTFSDDIKEDIEAAGQLSDNIAKADKIDRKLLVERQKANVKINDIRTKAYDTERFNNKERIAFLEEAIKIEDGITNKEIQSARLRFEAKKTENNLVAEVRKEDADEQAKLEAKLFELEAKKLNRQREVSNQRQMILRKENKEIERIKKEADDKEIERVQSVQEIIDEIKTTKEDEKAETEIQKNDLEEERRLAELATFSATEEQKQIIREFYAGKRKELEEKNIKEEGIKDKIVANAKMNMAKQTLMNITNVLGKSSAAGKAAAVAASLINTYQGITAELATKTFTPFEFGIKLANIATTSAIGFKAVKNILSTNTKSTGGSPSSGGGRQITAPPTPPSFNVVGTAPENQLAEALGEQQDKPLQAFVVGSEVTSQQALDRNIVDNASLG